MPDINERLVTIEAMLLIQKGQIEILLGLISSKIGKDELIKYLVPYSIKAVIKNR